MTALILGALSEKRKEIMAQMSYPEKLTVKEWMRLTGQLEGLRMAWKIVVRTGMTSGGEEGYSTSALSARTVRVLQRNREMEA